MVSAFAMLNWQVRVRDDPCFRGCAVCVRATLCFSTFAPGFAPVTLRQPPIRGTELGNAAVAGISGSERQVMITSDASAGIV
jgi:hypothetical protein